MNSRQVSREPSERGLKVEPPIAALGEPGARELDVGFLEAPGEPMVRELDVGSFEAPGEPGAR